jgi:viroplasmin and RNaseH domain-containing protein
MAKSKYKYYASINDRTEAIVTTWKECAAIAEGTPGGFKQGTLTYEEAEVHLQRFIKERTARLKSKKPKRNYYTR